MIFGYSLLEGIGSALMIPPIYILITVAFDDVESRAKYFGARQRRGPDWARPPGHSSAA